MRPPAWSCAPPHPGWPTILRQQRRTPWGEEWRFQPASGPLLRVPVAGPFTSDNAEALRAATLGGAGIALLPAWAIADELRGGRLMPLMPDYPPPPSVIAAVYPSNRLMSARVKLFVDHLARHIGRPPYWEAGL